MATDKRSKGGSTREDARAPGGRRKYNPKRAAAADGASRYGGYGQSGYDEEAADEPGVQVDFDEEENRDTVPQRDGEISRKGAKAPRQKAKKQKKRA